MNEVEPELYARERSVLAGVDLSADQWAALPRAARDRLQRLPFRTPAERRRYAAVLRWLLETFPPGWNHEA